MCVYILQQSSGVFAYLKDNFEWCGTDDPTPDLQLDTINALSALMLAQAQDCFVRKALAGQWRGVATSLYNDKHVYIIICKPCIMYIIVYPMCI